MASLFSPAVWKEGTIMKLIAHRGGRLGPENSLEALCRAARSGADAVECDLRRTRDGVPVIFHDDTLFRLTGNPSAVSALTLEEMKALLTARGHGLLTFDALCRDYREPVPILLHIKQQEGDEALSGRIAASGLPLIAGVVSLPMLQAFRGKLPRERILSFMKDPSEARAFWQAGAGILRLWEQWLDGTTPDALREACPGAEVFVMACRLRTPPEQGTPLESMDGSPESLSRCAALHADGVLLNDIEMALAWRAART